MARNVLLSRWGGEKAGQERFVMSHEWVSTNSVGSVVKVTLKMLVSGEGLHQHLNLAFTA